MIVDLYVLAAGRSVRMGRPKPLVELGGCTLLARAVRAGQASSARYLTVITGSARDQVEQEAHSLGAPTVWNDRYRDGLAGSVAAAARHARNVESPAGGILLAGCDQPFLTAGLLDRMMAEAVRKPGKAVACSYGGTLGVPALFPASWWSELSEISGDRGAKAVLQSHRERLILIPWEDGSVNLNQESDLDRIDPSSLPDPANPIMET